MDFAGAGWLAHRLLAARRRWREGFRPRRRHGLALLVHRAGAVPEGRDDQLGGARRRRERDRRRDDVDRGPEVTRNNYRAHGVGLELVRRRPPLQQIQNTLTLPRRFAPGAVSRSASIVTVPGSMSRTTCAGSTRAGFTWVSEASGWRHYVGPATGNRRATSHQRLRHREPRLSLRGSVRVGTDEKSVTVYSRRRRRTRPSSISIARSSTARAPARHAGDGAGDAPDIAPGGRWAIHSWSPFPTPRWWNSPAAEPRSRAYARRQRRAQARVGALTRVGGVLPRPRRRWRASTIRWLDDQATRLRLNEEVSRALHVYEPVGQTVQDAWGGGQYPGTSCSAAGCHHRERRHRHAATARTLVANPSIGRSAFSRRPIKPKRCAHSNAGLISTRRASASGVGAAAVQ